MKMVFIAYNVGIHEEVIETLRGLGLTSYTRWNEVTGAGRTAGPHLGTDVWPALNSAMVVAAEDDRARALLDAVRDLKSALGRLGIKAYAWTVEETDQT